MTLAEQFRQEGCYKGIQEAILTNLELRLGSVPEGLEEAICAVWDEARFRSLLRASLTCSTLEEFASAL